MYARILMVLLLLCLPSAALARNIVLTNDDGLTSNVRALYEALKAQGHDVIVAIPCMNQSGMGAAVKFYQPIVPLRADCRNGAARAGEPGAGPVTRQGFERDYFYVDSTPVMAMLYGLDVVAPARWGRPPDVVISGPNKGQNVGPGVVSSGTVSNAQVAAARGIPAIALSAGLDTVGDADLRNAKSELIARRSAELIAVIAKRSGGDALLPAGVALNVNFPDENLASAPWRLAVIGTYEVFKAQFVEDLSKTEALSPEMRLAALPGVAITRNTQAPTPIQTNDEAAVHRDNIAVSVMQVGYDHQSAQRKRVGRQLRGLLSD